MICPCFQSRHACLHVARIPLFWRSRGSAREARFLVLARRRVRRALKGHRFDLRRESSACSVGTRGCEALRRRRRPRVKTPPMSRYSRPRKAIAQELLTHYPQGAQVQTDFVEERVPGGRVVVPAVAVPPPAAVKRTLEGVQQPSFEKQEASGDRTLRQTPYSRAVQSF